MNMDFNGPGTSLFQGSDLNSIDNNAQREEEEEAIEDQRRRDIELKNMLENAFDDVSFDNEDCSGLNSSFNQLHINNHNDSHNFVNDGIINKSQSSMSDFHKHYSDDHPKEFHTPIRHSKNIRTKIIDFNNHYDNDTYPDEFRIKQQNGSLHDIVDASGGGDAGFSLHYNHCVGSSSVGECKSFPAVSPKTENVMALNKVYQNAEYNSIEQLKILYEVRVREVHRLTELVDQMKNQHQIESNELKRELAFAAAEKERHKIAHNDMQSLLISNKEENEMLKREIGELKKVINKLEESKEELLTELETSRATINDLERKLLAIEKGHKDKTAFMQYEANLQELREKHALDLKKAVEDLNVYKTNFEKASKENDELKYKINQLNQINDENLAKKSEIIHRLSKQIEEMQVQCEKLMKSSFSEDNIKLQMEMKILVEENNTLSSKLQDLEKNLANQEAELKQYECLSNFSNFEIKNSSESTPDKENEYSEINRKLREELFRALNSQKARRQEIQSLQSLIKKKDEQIHCMAEKERLFLAEAAKFRNEIGVHISELKKHENIAVTKENENKKLLDLLNNTKSELETKLKSNQKKNEELQKENERLQEELKVLRDNLEKDKLETMSKYNEEYLKFHNEGLKKVKDELQENFKLELLGKDIEIENLKKEVEEVKNLYVEVYNEKESLLNKLDKEKISLSRSSVDVDEVKRLQKELEKSRQRILDLDLTLRRQYQQEVEKLNGDIKCLNLEFEKLKKEKDYESTEKDKIITVNELLKTEIEQVTSEKNLYFLKCETLRKEIDQLKKDLEKFHEESDREFKKMTEEHTRETEDTRNRYEIQIQKLNKEIELMLTKSICTESKYTSPIKQYSKNLRNTGVQGSPVSVQSASTSPICKSTTKESCTSPICDFKRDSRTLTLKGLSRDKSVLTDLEPKNLSKVEVIRIMEQLGMGHEEEMNLLEKKYKAELVKLDRKWQSEVDLITEKLRVEMLTAHSEELEKLQEKHRIEMENRIEQEKKEAVVALITEWACEVQALKQSQAEAQAEVEKMKMKYKAAKNSALHYKTYFTNKAELMKEEWRKVEDGYEKALKELERNVHLLVDVREDEVKAKVESIATAYEQKINKMKCKLEKYEDLLRNEVKDHGKRMGSGRNSNNDEKKSKDSASDKGLDRLVIPNTHLCRKSKQNGATSKEGKGEGSAPKDHRIDRSKKPWKDNQCKKLYVEESYDVNCGTGTRGAVKRGNS